MNTLIRKVWQGFETAKFNLGVRLISKYFKYVDLYSKDDDNILGVLFTNSKKYADYCVKFEQKNNKKKQFIKGRKA
jgi:hypothetical protein